MEKYDPDCLEAQSLDSYNNDSEDGLLLLSSAMKRDRKPEKNDAKSSNVKRRVRFVVGLFLFIAGNVLSLLLGAYLRDVWSSRNLDSTCAKHTTQHSPVLDEVPIKYAARIFNGSFMEEDIYRQPGSPEVDAAWEAMGVDYRAAIISEDQGRRSGLTSAHVQRSAKYGGGFFVNVEGLHHLHCLNLVRKSLWFNFDYYRALGSHAFKNDEDILRLHVTHCVDTLRQVLMCNADTGVLGQVWYRPEDAKAFPDFNTKHTCKNYDDIREWAQISQAPPIDKLPSDYMKLPEAGDVLPNIP